MNNVFETTRLIFRKVTKDDLEGLYAILRDPDVMYFSPTGVLDRQGVEQFLSHILQSYEKHGYGLWAVIYKENKQLIGFAGLKYQIIDDKSYVEISYRFAKKYWGMGFASEALNAIKDFAFNILQIDRLICIIDPKNKPSIRVAKKAGLVKVASTKWYENDVDIYDIHRIVVLSYNPKWQELYEKEVSHLQQVFAQHKIEFYHMGSTAIVGCAAKDIIDILGVTGDISSIDSFNTSLEEIGYTALGEYGMKQRRYFRKKEPLAVNMHIFESDNPEVTRHLRFRDYLNHHPDDVKRYSILKKELAAKDAANIKAYILGKEDFIKEIDYKVAMEDGKKYWYGSDFSRKMQWSHDEIIQSMEANMHLQMTYFAKYIPQMQILFEPDATVVISTLPDDSFNYILNVRFIKENLASRVAYILGLYRSKKLPFSWWVGERDEPASLPEELKKQGLSIKEDNIGMFLALDQIALEKKVDELDIQPLFTRESLVDFTSVMVSLGGYAQVYEEFFSKIPPVLYSEKSPFRIFVGYLHNKPVVTGILVLNANVGGIYYLMTDPKHRRKGYGRDMMVHLILAVQKEGYNLVTLQASASGVSLYQKLGFESICRFVEYA